jgi:spermidine synthase
MLLISACTLLPTGLLHGALFTSGVGLSSPAPSPPDPRSPIPGRVYVVETLGSIVGGLLLSTLLIGRMSSFQIAMAIAALNAVVLLSMTRRRIAGNATGGLLLVGAIGGLALGLPAALDRSTLMSLYPGSRIVYSGDSHCGNITILRRTDQFAVLSDGAPTVTLPVPDFGSAEDLVHIPMLSLREPGRVLLIGGGMAGPLAELLKYPSVHIDYCEPNPTLIPVLRRHIPHLDSSGLMDPRVAVPATDGRRYLQDQPAARYDLIIIGNPSPTTLQANRYFSIEFLALARSRLKSDGLLVSTTPGSAAYLSDRLAALNLVQLKTLQREFPSVTVIPGEANLFLSSATNRPDRFRPETLAARIARLGLSTRTVTSRSLADRLSPRRKTEFEQRIAESGLRNANRGMVNSDRQPVLVLATLGYWAGMSGPAVARLLAGLVGSRLWLILAVVVGLIAAFVLGRRRIHFALRFAVFSSGFAGASAGILILLLFQTSSGTLHLHLALLTTALMAGTALGGMSATRRVRGLRPVIGIVYWLEAGVAVIGTLALLGSYLLDRSGPAAALAGYGLLALVTGFLLGAEFPIANRVYLDSAPDTALVRTVGGLYSADLFGGVIGSLLVPVLLVPALGVLPTVLLVMLVKAASITMLRVAR